MKLLFLSFHYENLNKNSVVDNKLFWKNVLYYLTKFAAKKRFI